MAEHTHPHAPARHHWRASSHSGPSEGNCVEVLDGHPSGVPVRDSKDPQGPALLFSTDGWSSFIRAVRAGEFQP